ncbi:polysaccharide biosynthesis protein [Dendrosporobacter sp. 1207_IL3150]|uniref:polysaccharide biosynthesis protein n=1 Tax=Dendrosporobacter sp. 1207_IL3150 TaxID=3084054 RepID=UPI002FDB3825
MRRRILSLLLMFADVCIVSLVPFIALYIRFEGVIPNNYLYALLRFIPVIIAVRISIFYFFGLYNRLWRYASINELLCIVGAVTVSTLILTTYLIYINAGVPRSTHILSWFLNILLIGGIRLAVKIYYYFRNKTKECNTQSNLLIIGAGDAGAMIAREMIYRYHDSRKLVGFVDDDPLKQKKEMFGARVLGTRENIQSIVQDNCVNEIIIAMPSITGNAIRKIINECKKTKCELKILPGLYELIDGKVTVQQLRNVEVEDLLRREPVKLDIDEISAYLTGKTVLITGAGGSIGSELCRQVAKISPQSVVLLGKGENSIYEIHRELLEKNSDLRIIPIIADIRDKNRIYSIFAEFRPQVVFHAAAHKHVPLMEAQPAEAVLNNIFGTKTVAEAADRFNVETFIMISTDKAVNPTSVMGATKRAAEMIIQHLNNISNTKYAAVRFGNVLGSRGSVIPLFKKQIAKGGPITVTHPDMNRYFMTIPEATQLVLQAGAMARGGEVFLLDMGQPVKIVDLALDLIRLSGLEFENIQIKYTGLRPGEKLFEELLTDEEGTTSTKHTKIFIANLNPIDTKKLITILLSLETKRNSCNEIKNLLFQLIGTYKPYKVKDQNLEHNVSIQNKSTETLLKNPEVLGIGS